MVQESSVRESRWHSCLSVISESIQLGSEMQIHVLSSKHQVLTMDDWFFLSHQFPQKGRGCTNPERPDTFYRPFLLSLAFGFWNLLRPLQNGAASIHERKAAPLKQPMTHSPTSLCVVHLMAVFKKDQKVDTGAELDTTTDTPLFCVACATVKYGFKSMARIVFTKCLFSCPR